jgi:hypothetical protein
VELDLPRRFLCIRLGGVELTWLFLLSFPRCWLALDPEAGLWRLGPLVVRRWEPKCLKNKAF